MQNDEIRKQVKTDIIQICDVISEGVLEGGIIRVCFVTMAPDGDIRFMGAGACPSDYLGMLAVAKSTTLRKIT